MSFQTGGISLSVTSSELFLWKIYFCLIIYIYSSWTVNMILQGFFVCSTVH